MPPIKRTAIHRAEAALSQPLVSENKLSHEIIELNPADIRMGVIAIADTVEIGSILSDHNLRRRLHLLYNLENYIDKHQDGFLDSKLREGQQDVIHDIYDFVRTPPKDENGNDVIHGYIKLPTGVGKTAIFSTLVDVLNKPLPGEDSTLKSLVLVPKLDLVDQTIGINGERGFAQFGKDTSVSRYTGYEKNLSGDAVVMTYLSFVRAAKAGRINKDMFDLIICDEAHRGLGEETVRVFEDMAADTLVLGLTATPEFKSKHVRDIMPYEIHSLELREAIESGLLASVQCYAVTSDAKIETLKAGEFNDAELNGLIVNEWRNQRAVEFVRRFVEDGRQGIVSCVPGDDKKHAHDMADLISKELIVDPDTNELRRIRALAITGTTADRAALYEKFENGEYDVFTYVDVLTEGWDSEVASFLVNLRPTTSPVNATQRLGRVLRKRANHKISTIIEFIDDTAKPLHTFFHVLGETSVEQGKVFGKQTHDSDNPVPRGEASGDRVRPELLELSDELRQRLADIDHVELASLLVGNQEIPEAPEGTVSMVRFAQEHNFSTAKFADRLRSHGIEPVTAMLLGRATLCLVPEMQDLAIERIVNMRAEKADAGVKSISVIARELGMNQYIVTRLIEEAGIPTLTARFGPKTAEGLTEESQKLFYDLPYFNIEEAPDTSTTITGLAKELSTSEITVRKYLEGEGIVLRQQRRKGRIDDFMTRSEADRLKIILKERLSAPEDGVVSVVALGNELNLTPATIRKVVDRLGIETKTYKFGKAGVGAGVTAEDKKFITEAVERSRDETLMSVVAFSQELRVTKPTLLKIMAELDLEPVKLLIGTGYVVPLDMRNIIKAAIQDGTVSIRGY